MGTDERKTDRRNWAPFFHCRGPLVFAQWLLIKGQF